MKHLEGKEVFLIPTMNSARGNKEKSIKGKITKVARVNVTIIIGERGQEEKYRHHGINISNDSNFGYKVFESEQAIDDHIESIDISKRISQKFQYGYGNQLIEISKLRQAAELLGV